MKNLLSLCLFVVLISSVQGKSLIPNVEKYTPFFEEILLTHESEEDLPNDFEGQLAKYPWFAGLERYSSITNGSIISIKKDFQNNLSVSAAFLDVKNLVSDKVVVSVPYVHTHNPKERVYYFGAFALYYNSPAQKQTLKAAIEKDNRLQIISDNNKDADYFYVIPKHSKPGQSLEIALEYQAISSGYNPQFSTGRR